MQCNYCAYNVRNYCKLSNMDLPAQYAEQGSPQECLMNNPITEIREASGYKKQTPTVKLEELKEYTHGC